MTFAEYLRRYLLLAIGLTIMAVGIAFSIKSDLGTSPISSPPYVLSEFTPITVGQATIGLHVIFIIGQILILRSHYNPVQLMQLPVAFLFGWLCDVALEWTAGVTYTSYAEQWIYCIIGIVLVGIGVACEVAANVVVLAGEGIVLAVKQAGELAGRRPNFGVLKVANDLILVTIAVVMSLVFIGPVVGVREGTLASAIATGWVVDLFARPFAWVDRHLLRSRTPDDDGAARQP